MAQTNVNISMDEDLKKQFEVFCSDVGISMTTAFTVFAKTVVRQQKIPFELTADIPNSETIAAIQEVQEMKKNPERYKSYTNVDEMMKELLA